jgi:fatty-acyl-CoA synthase
MVVSLGATFAAGASLVLQETFDAEEALDLIERERATALRAWPHQERAMAERPSAARRDLSSVTKINATSPLAPLIAKERDDWGTQGGYGLSETFTVVTDTPARAPAAVRRSTSGRPLPGVELRIVDVETGVPQPTGQEGEIVVRGPTLMRGYHKMPPSSGFDTDGFFHTQDLGFVDAAGWLHWTGRASSLIKTGGANVSPLEIEREMGTFPGVRIAHAIGVPHPERGEAVILCVVPSEGARLEEEEIRRFLRQRLASYKVPERVLFFEAAEVPLTSTEKVRAARLRSVVQERLGKP